MPPVSPSHERVSFPDWLVWSVLAVSFLPSVVRLCGGDLGLEYVTKGNLESNAEPVSDPLLAPATRAARGVAIHVLLEWTSICISAFSVVFAVTHYSIRRDVTTPIIAAALFCAGLMDFFRVLAILGITERPVDFANFVPFTWALARTYHACILLAGTIPFVVNRHNAEARLGRVTRRYLVVTAVAFLVLSYELVHLCAINPLPQSIYPNWPVSRPWDVIPLIGYMAAIGFVLPRFHAMYPSLFAHGLVVSMVPNVLAECHAAFGSRSLFDHDSVSSQLLKIVAYVVPLCGLILDYVRAHESDVQLQTTREKLRLARDVQESLLPQKPPTIDGYDVAGRSVPTEAVGGDSFDYLLDHDGHPAFVVSDVSGHELAASIVLAQTSAYLRALATRDDEPPEILAQLNRFLQAEVLDQWFVTMFFARLDAATGELLCVGAGHEARIVRADPEAPAQVLGSTCSPLGMVDNPPRAAAEPLALERGDVLLLASDGINEATNETGEQFGWPRAVDVVRQSIDRPAAEIVDAVFDAVDRFRASPAPLDDTTCVVVKRLPTEPT